jgi:hypothetical protein
MSDLMTDIGDAGLFAYDTFDEDATHRSTSVLERPQLSRVVVDAALSAVRADGRSPHVLVVDTLEDLGIDDIERAAVFSALQTWGCRVRAGGTEVSARWYHDQVARSTFSAIDRIAQQLTDTRHLQQTIADWWAEVGVEQWIPTETGRHKPAAQRLRELIEDEGLSFTAAARVMTAEGYPNPRGQATWYTTNVRRAYEGQS